MKNVILYQPKVEDFWFRQKLLVDEKTMDYNAGYELAFDKYHYDTGCVDFPKNKWKSFEEKMKNPNFFYAYIKDVDKNVFVGEVNCNINEKTKIATMGIVIKNEFRGQGYMRPVMPLLFKEAKKRNVKILSDTVPETRKNALKVFYDFGFEKTGEFLQKKFNTKEKVIIIEKVLI